MSQWKTYIDPRSNLHNGNECCTYLCGESYSALNAFVTSPFNQSFPPLASEGLPEKTCSGLSHWVTLTWGGSDICCITLMHHIVGWWYVGYDAQHTASTIRPIIMNLFILSVRTCNVLTAWKTSAVVLISVSKDGADPSIHQSLFYQCALRHLDGILSSLCYPISVKYVQYIHVPVGVTSQKLTTTASLSITTGINSLNLALKYFSIFIRLLTQFSVVGTRGATDSPNNPTGGPCPPPPPLPQYNQALYYTRSKYW